MRNCRLPVAELFGPLVRRAPTQQSSCTLATFLALSMSIHSFVDRESFQTLLANAFAVQESGMGTQSLRVLLELQRRIATSECDVDRTIQQVADRARQVANATGTAIALLQGDQLVFRAGSGCAATYVGRHMTAILSASARSQGRGEILRVENAQRDARIEAAICREFGANSLLILPIYRGRVVAGVLEILFDEAHAFEDHEVQTYRLMVGLAEEAMFRDADLDHKKDLAKQPATVLHAIELITSQMQEFRGRQSTQVTPPKHEIGVACGMATATAGESRGVRPQAKGATTLTLLVKRASLNTHWWKVAAAGIVTALVIANWIAYDHPPESPVVTPGFQRPGAAGPQVASVPAKASSANLISKPQTEAGGTQGTKVVSTAFKRVRVRLNEVDYIAEDVTIRHFTPKSALPHIPVGPKRVNFGEDVTVRYFVSKPEVRPVSNSEQSPDR